MKVHWKPRKRFGHSAGRHSKSRLQRKTIFTSRRVSPLKLTIKKLKTCSLITKKTVRVLFPETITRYRCKKLSDLRMVLRRMRNISVNGYRMMNLDCLENHMNSILKHVILCDPAKELVMQDQQLVKIVSELKTHGLASILSVQCLGCSMCFNLDTSPKLKRIGCSTTPYYDVNVRAVWGSVVTGNGASHLKEIMATMDSPSLSQPAFTNIESLIGSWWEHMSEDELLAAGEEERRIAIESGVFHQGVPAITVIADGGWSKRSHKHSYNALGGVAIIIGQKTGKILYIGIRNKYSYICSRSQNNQQPIPEHNCYKNWHSNSQAMESDMIVEGFSKAESMHGLRYMWLVGDGDSSVFARINEEIPVWGNSVCKIECANHVCKCLRSSLEKLVDSNPHYKGKNNLTKSIRVRLVSAVRCAIRLRSKEQNKTKAAVQLEKDIRNSIHHIFGNHDNCSDFCKAKLSPVDTSSIDNVDTPDSEEPTDMCLQTHLLWQEGSSLQHQEMSRQSTSLSYQDLKSDMLSDISVLLDRVATKSKRLIANATTNLAECWMHMRTKFDGGKVYNLCNRGSWHTRCYGGCLRMNIGPQWSPIVWRQTTDSQPGFLYSKLYKERDHQLSLSNISKKKPAALANRWKRKVSAVQESSTKSARTSYGLESLQCEDDISVSDQQNAMESFLKKHIDISPDKINAINIITNNQSYSSVWHQERKKRITASNFGLILKRKTSTPIKKIVEQLLYKSFKGNEYTLFGLNQERNSIHEYILKKAEEGINVKVERSGFVIHSDSKFIGGSPDGVVFLDDIKSGLIEVKNVLKNKKINLNQAAKSNKTFFLAFENEKLSLKKNHNYYYQCQGILHVCNLPWIDFVVRTIEPYQLHIERINKDNKLWDSWLPKLKAFYERVLLPELASPRHGKLPGIREPGIWFSDTAKLKQSTSSTTKRKSKPKPPTTCTTSDSVVSISSQVPRTRRASSAKVKFLGRQIKHRWKLSDDSDQTEWYTASVTSLLSGVDGCPNAEYEVLYDNDNETYVIDHLVEDFKEGSVQFLDV